MTQTNELFGALRSALAQPPSDEAWLALCGELDRWDDEDLEQVALPYTRDHLRRWPDALRVVPPRWIGSIARGERVAAAQVCTRLALEEPRRDEEEALMQRLNGPQLDHVSALHVLWSSGGQKRQAACVEALSAAATSLKLRSLALVGGGVDDQDVARLLDAPALAALRELSLHQSQLSYSSVAAILMAPSLSELRALDLSGASSWPDRRDGVTFARATQHITSRATLSALALEGDRLGPDDMRALTRLVTSALGALYLSENTIGAEGAAQLARASSLGGLERLELASCGLGERGPAALVQGAPFKWLRELNLYYNQMGDGVAALAQAELPLERVNLGGNIISAEGGRELALASWMERVAELELGWNELGDAGAAALLKAKLPALRALDLSTNKLTSALAQTLRRAPCVESLYTLRLRENGLGDAIIDALRGAQALRHLDLSFNGLTDAAAYALASSPNLATLERLHLSKNHISDAGLAALLGSPHLSALRVLDVSHNPCDQRLVPEPMKRAPQLSVMERKNRVIGRVDLGP